MSMSGGGKEPVVHQEAVEDPGKRWGKWVEVVSGGFGHPVTMGQTWLVDSLHRKCAETGAGTKLKCSSRGTGNSGHHPSAEKWRPLVGADWGRGWVCGVRSGILFWLSYVGYFD